jgi:hypothetical protein
VTIQEGEDGIHARATVASELDNSAKGLTTLSELSVPEEIGGGERAKVPSNVGNLTSRSLLMFPQRHTCGDWCPTIYPFHFLRDQLSQLRNQPA